MLGISYIREFELPVLYKGQTLDSFYRADFVCYSSVIVDLIKFGFQPESIPEDIFTPNAIKKKLIFRRNVLFSCYISRL
ncbi:MAG: hypothetical protein CVV51_01035 [Spirochaetae bacterium HGW-Spirochaetae-7]|nr:MAG: hypothetical protein CVV51_01035 [Spirochaetae bacterium HGW-Spirochaetae-7]